MRRFGLGGGLAAGSEGPGGERGLQLGVEFGRGERAGGLAQAFNVIEGAALGEKDVDHEVHIVEENPFAVTAALDGVGKDAEILLEAMLDLIGDSDGLAVIGG